MTIKESTTFLFELTHPERSATLAALEEYFEGMYCG